MYPVRTLLSTIPESDLALFQLEESPFATGASAAQPGADVRLRTLPVSPYPAEVNTELSVSSFGGWVPRDAPDLPMLAPAPTLTEAQVAKSRWGRARLVGYKDSIGRTAKTGTYDDLFALDFKLNRDAPENDSIGARGPPSAETTFPLPGSSGGPIVDTNTRSVVGIVRGYRVSQIEGSRGDAVPAEKIFECTFSTARSANLSFCAPWSRQT